MTTTPNLEELRSRMRAAQDAWQAATGDAKIVAAKVAGRLEGEYRMAKMGRYRKAIPAGHKACGRCGGYGGSDQWPGFVCFGCDGRGTVEA